MAKIKARETDSLEVQKLIELHIKLNHGGEHWIKGALRRFITGKGNCWCLAGGVRSVARTESLRKELFSRLYEQLPSRFKKAAYHAEGACIRFNDNDVTKWPDVENVIIAAIEDGRRNNG